MKWIGNVFAVLVVIVVFTVVFLLGFIGLSHAF